jgi:hypothetical protein
MFERFEAVLESYQKPGIVARSSAYARMSASELAVKYEEASSRTSTLVATMTNIMEEYQQAGREMSELLFIMSLHRTFEPRNASLAQAPAGSSPSAGVSLDEGSDGVGGDGDLDGDEDVDSAEDVDGDEGDMDSDA